jgi:hypothetical protein
MNNRATYFSRFPIHVYDGFAVDYDTQRQYGGGSRWFYVWSANPGDTIGCWNGAHLTDGGV